MTTPLNIAIIGLGGVGNAVALNLFPFTRAEIMGWRLNKMLFVDADTYSSSNIPRQFMAGAMLGRNKADAWKTVYERSKWNLMEVRFMSRQEWITRDSVTRILADFDGSKESSVVFVCVDNHPARLVMSDWLKTQIAESGRKGVAIIQGGSQTEYATADIHGKWLDSHGLYVEIGRPIEEGHPEIMDATEGDRSTISCEELAMSHTGDQSYPDNFMAASMMISLLFTLLTPTGGNILSKYVGEMMDLTLHYHQINKNINQGFPEEENDNNGKGENTENHVCDDGCGVEGSDPTGVPAHEAAAPDNGG